MYLSNILSRISIRTILDASQTINFQFDINQRGIKSKGIVLAIRIRNFKKIIQNIIVSKPETVSYDDKRERT